VDERDNVADVLLVFVERDMLGSTAGEREDTVICAYRQLRRDVTYQTTRSQVLAVDKPPDTVFGCRAGPSSSWNQRHTGIILHSGVVG